MDQPQPAPLRREVERPGTGGRGLAPLVVLGAAMASSVMVAVLALAVPRRVHHGREVRSDDSFARPVAPAAAPATPAMPMPNLAPAGPCAPRVYRSGEVQEWTFETCASAPMPRNFVPR